MHSPAEAWQEIRAEPVLSYLEDREIWDLVAYIWSIQSMPGDLAEGGRLYAANCAACHGERGTGDGVMATALGVETAQPDQESHKGDSENHGIDGHDTV